MADKRKYDVDGMTVPELRAMIAAAEAKIEEIQAEAKLSMRAKLEEMAAAAGFSLDEILARPSAPKADRKARKAGDKSVPVKYRGPNGEGWSGRGRQPKWLSALEAEGRSRDEFRV